MREVEVTPTAAGRFEAVIGGDRFTRFSQLADDTHDRFLGRSIWNINAVGLGDAAEMLRGLVATGMGLGVDTRWLVIDGDAGFFAITKRIHNCVRGWPGDGGPLGGAERRHYESVVGANRESLHELMSPGDIEILHDPMTAGMVDMAKETGAPVVWCCHIGRDVANESTRLAWDFLSPYVAQVDAVVFSRAEHVPASLAGTRTVILPPAIDPFAVKNVELDHKTVVSILGAPRAGPPPPGSTPRSCGRVRRSSPRTGRWQAAGSPCGSRRATPGRTRPGRRPPRRPGRRRGRGSPRPAGWTRWRRPGRCDSARQRARRSPWPSPPCPRSAGRAGSRCRRGTPTGAGARG